MLTRACRLSSVVPGIWALSDGSRLLLVSARSPEDGACFVLGLYTGSDRPDRASVGVVFGQARGDAIEFNQWSLHERRNRKFSGELVASEDRAEMQLSVTEPNAAGGRTSRAVSATKVDAYATEAANILRSCDFVRL
eukprot:TRINITY_DN3621_c0_g1_i1.p1 TRINITY_DN3621_c0_g1~~TRINITY_DN3621_c0_g1_i1.p1  ORF type:complete len:137 (+),score=26.21 TRINITY_DN3621_c0_g1_i1:563-973(+)